MLKKVVSISLILILIAAVSFISSARAVSIRIELLRAKRGTAYVTAMIHLWIRDPVRDAGGDLFNGDRDLYCVGGYSCDVVGVGWPIPDGFPVEPTATSGCVIRDGDLEMAYRRAEERYVTSYNRAKLLASRERVTMSCCVRVDERSRRITRGWSGRGPLRDRRRGV